MEKKEGHLGNSQNNNGLTMEEKQAATWNTHEWGGNELPTCKRCGGNAIGLGYYGDDDWKKGNRGWEDSCPAFEPNVIGTMQVTSYADAVRIMDGGDGDIPVMEELMDMGHVVKPDPIRNVVIEQPDGSAFITDNVQAEMTCKCGKSKMWMHAGQISTPCPYCRRQYLAVHQRKTGNFKFIHYNSWWRRLIYLILRGPTA